MLDTGKIVEAKHLSEALAAARRTRGSSMDSAGKASLGSSESYPCAA